MFVEGGSIDGGEEPRYSGILRYWRGAFRALKEADIDVYLVTTRDSSPLRDTAQDSAIEVDSLSCEGWRTYLRGASRLRAICDAVRPDVIHANEPIQGFIAGLAFRRSSSPKIVYHRHHLAHSWKIGILDWLATRLADAVIVVSESVAHEVSSSSKVFVALNGICPLREVGHDEIRLLRESLGVTDESVVFGCIGHLRREKGHRTLLAACSLARQAVGSELEVLIVGDGPERGPLEQAASSLSRVRFVGHQVDVALWLRTVDVIVLPSQREGFGLVAVEAMAAGTPILAAGTGGLNEVITSGVEGFHFPPEDALELARLMVRLIDDVAIRKTLGENGVRRYRSSFMPGQMVDRWRECYAAIAKPSRFDPPPPPTGQVASSGGDSSPG